MPELTKKHVISGMTWNGLSLFVSQGLNMAVKLLLAYYLLPEHFGLIALASVTVNLVAMYVDMGLGAALIQRKYDDLRPEHWNVGFFLNMTISWLGFGIIALIIAPIAAKYYKTPDIKSLAILLSLPLLWSPISFIHRIKLTKAMMFRNLFFAQTFSAIIGGIIGISMAINDCGIWSIAGQSLGFSLVSTLFITTQVKWMPSCVFSVQAAKDLFSFGLLDFGARLVGMFNNEVSVFIIAYFFSPVLVGTFYLANNLTVRFIKPINKIISKVFFPFFSEIKSDRNRILKYFTAQVSFTAFILFPVFGGLIAIAKPLCELLGEKWLLAIWPIRYLSLTLIVVILPGIPTNVFKGLGKMKLYFIANLVKYVFVRFLLILVCIVWLGFKGFFLGYFLSQVINAFIDFYFLKRFIGFGVSQSIKAVSESFLTATVMLCVLLLFSSYFNLKPIYELSSLILLGVLIYPTFYYIVFKSKISWYLDSLQAKDIYLVQLCSKIFKKKNIDVVQKNS